MPDDLLRFVGGPMPYATAWLWWGLLLLAAVFCWWAGVLAWTLPADRLRGLPGARRVHAVLLRRRFARAVHGITARHRDGALTAAEAGHELSRTMRSFLQQATGVRAQYLHLDEIASGDLAAAAPVLAALDDARFNTGSAVAVTDVGARAEELIRSWP